MIGSDSLTTRYDMAVVTGLLSREIRNQKGQAMEIERTKFGSITIDRKIYEHDVVIRLSGEVIKRKKKLSKKYYGTSHVLSKDESKICL